MFEDFIREGDHDDVVFLPWKVRGHLVLESELGWFRLRKGCLGTRSLGIKYRASKHIEDVSPGPGLLWGSAVYGLDDGDGWVRIPVEKGEPRVAPPRKLGICKRCDTEPAIAVCAESRCARCSATGNTGKSAIAGTLAGKNSQILCV